MKRQSKGWEKIFAYHISDKRSICKICKGTHTTLTKSKQTKTQNTFTNLIKQWAKKPEQTFFPKNIFK